MDTDVVVALIQIAPGVFWVLLAAILVALFFRPIRDHLLPRMRNLNIFGVEATFVRARMDRAIAARSARVSDGERAHAVRRVCRLSSVFHGATVLWADAAPSRTSDERAMLLRAGVSIEVSRSRDKALALFTQGSHDVMIVTLRPRRGQAAILKLVAEAARQVPGRPIILYAYPGYDTDATPPGAFAITDRPDELLHCVADALERTRS
jgi:hypothetical protein